MDGITPMITALKETPIPTILVIAGIAFLLLSIAGQLAGRIAVPPERQRWAAVVGSMLLVAGVALYVVPRARIISRPSEVPPPSSSKPATTEKPTPLAPEASPGTQPPPSPTAPTQDLKVESIKSHDVRLTRLRFFITGPSNEKLYKRRFAKAFTGLIHAEITLKHPKPRRRIDFVLQGRLRDQTGNVISTQQISSYIAADWESSLHAPNTDPIKGLPGASWSVGSYTFEAFINDQKMTSGTFEVVDE